MRFFTRFQNSPVQNILSSALCLLIGLGFVFSFVGFDLISIIIGLFIFAYAICRLILIVRLYAKDQIPLMFIGGFCYAILLAVAGVFLIFNAEAATNLIASIVGIFLLVKSGSALFSLAAVSLGTTEHDRAFWVSLVFSAVMFAMGVFLTVSPASALHVAAIPVGVLMSVQGAKDCYEEIKKYKSSKKPQTHKDYIEADFIDKSDPY